MVALASGCVWLVDSIRVNNCGLAFDGNGNAVLESVHQSQTAC